MTFAIANIEKFLNDHSDNFKDKDSIMTIVKASAEKGGFVSASRLANIIGDKLTIQFIDEATSDEDHKTIAFHAFMGYKPY